MRVLVTGSEGFVGQNLCAALPDVVRCDEKLGNADALGDLLVGVDAVCHLAANADVRFGWDQPARDIERNTVATANLLELMRDRKVKRLLFASSSSVYGNAPIPTPETYSGMQTSLYGASKIACEGLIGAYVEAGFLSATVLRLTSMLGPGYRHGLVKDFVEKLRESPRLEVLGGGSVARTRMHVADGVRAFTQRVEHDPGWEVFNVGTDETITSLEVAEEVARLLGVEAEITTVGESWAGDHPILLDCARLRATGWEPAYTIREALACTVEVL